MSDDSDSALALDAASGEVTFAGGADYEAQSAYNFGVITDTAGNNSEVQSVTLSIGNLDEVAPSALLVLMREQLMKMVLLK